MDRAFYFAGLRSKNAPGAARTISGAQSQSEALSSTRPTCPRRESILEAWIYSERVSKLRMARLEEIPLSETVEDPDDAVSLRDVNVTVDADEIFGDYIREWRSHYI